MNVLVACEESQEVCKAFRARGHEAYSCDLVPCSGGHPEWHVVGDCRYLITECCWICSRDPDIPDEMFGTFKTQDGKRHNLPSRWDLIIAHPPCTFLSSVGASRLFNPNHSIKDAERERKGWEARKFFMELLTANCDRIAVENPAPMKYYGLPRYDQIIEPYQFGHPWKKRTCLWLKNLPPLEPTEIVEPTGCWTVSGGGSTCRIRLKGKGGARSQRERARTFPGIAAAMAEQWGAKV